MLASLAVVVACSLGPAALPDGPAAAASAPCPAGPRTFDSASAAAGQARQAVIHWSGRAAEAAGPSGAASADLGAASRPGVPAGEPVPAAAPARRTGAGPVHRRHPVLLGLVPAAVGSRAPPAR